MLVARARAEAASGNELGAADQAVLECLEEGLTHYDAEQLAQTIDYVVIAKPCGDRKLNWGKLKERLRRPSSAKQILSH